MARLAFTPAAPLVAARCVHALRDGALQPRRGAAAPVPPTGCGCARVPPIMIQRPGGEGPPDLSAFFDKSSRDVGRRGAPISVGTGRAALAAHGGDAAATAAAATARAQEAVRGDGRVQLCHVTMALDVDAAAAGEAVRAALGDAAVPVLGRSVNKKDSAGTVEVLLLLSDEGTGIAYAEASVGAASAADLPAAAESAAAAAAKEAIGGLSSGAEACTFLLFAHSPGAPAEAARRGIDAAMPGVIAYGGPAVGDEETGSGWTLLGTGADGRGAASGSVDLQRVGVAAVPGSINFLISSVVASWAQPKFSEPLSYMTPNYVSDPSLDLLTAIRYDDWDKFIWCIEDQGVSVNTLWPEKQNQSPLLAACGRCRTRMVKYMLKAGADVTHRNAGNFTATMYTRKLTEYDEDVVLAQLRDLKDYGVQTNLSPEDEQAVRDSSGDGRIFLGKVE